MSAGEKRALLRLISSSCSAFSRSNEFEEVMMKAAPPVEGSRVLRAGPTPLLHGKKFSFFPVLEGAAKLGIPS